MITVVALDLTVLYQSAASARMLGRASESLLGTKLPELVHPDDVQRLRAACAEAADGISLRPVALRLRRADGGWLEGEALVRFDMREQALVLDTRDVSERNRAERRRRRHARHQELIVRLGARALAGDDFGVLMRDVVRELHDVLGVDYAAVLRRSHGGGAITTAAAWGKDPYGDATKLSAGRGSQPGLAIATGSPVIVRNWTAEQRFHEAGVLGAQGLTGAVAVPIAGAQEPFGAIVVQSRKPGRLGYDEAVLLQAIANVLAAARTRVLDEERIRHQALHDSLTGLPNRLLFADRLARALASGARHGRRLAVMFLDLDSFKLVKEGLGHASGDMLLKAFADRLAKCLRGEDTLARVGADEFAVLLPELAREEDVLRVVERINTALAKPLVIDGREIVTSAATGIALNQGAGHRESADTLMRDADLALFAAKERGPGSWAFYADHMHHTAVRQLELTSDLYRALEQDELEVYFQPIVSLGDEAIVGTEALVRWNHPRHGLLSPGVFMPIAEETGMILPLGRFVLRTACEVLTRWQQAGLAGPRLSVSVNLGRQQLAAPDLVDDVRSVLTDTGLLPSCLILEITEDVLLNREGMIERLRDLKSLGVLLAVDDFGTGYSALSHLQRYPIDIIKIDKAFVDGLGESADHARLIQGIIELTHSLGLRTVAEGIETGGQADALRTMGSELGQGFHFARPLPSRDIEALLAPAGDLELPVELGP